MIIVNGCKCFLIIVNGWKPHSGFKSGINLVFLLEYNFVQLFSNADVISKVHVNRPDVVSADHFQSFTAFLLDVHCLKGPHSLFAAVCPR